MLDLESAIKHCEEVADGQTEQGKCPECAEDHRQLAEWLRDYKRLKERESCDDKDITPKTIGYCGTADFMAEHFKYCNHCGAKMEE